MSQDFNLSKKEAIISIDINLSIKDKAIVGTSAAVFVFVEELEELINKYNNEDIFIKKSLGTALTHKEKRPK